MWLFRRILITTVEILDRMKKEDKETQNAVKAKKFNYLDQIIKKYE